VRVRERGVVGGGRLLMARGRTSAKDYGTIRRYVDHEMF
jgi:hypothetical protein